MLLKQAYSRDYHDTFNQASACYIPTSLGGGISSTISHCPFALSPFHCAVDSRYGTDVPSRNRNSLKAIRRSGKLCFRSTALGS